MAVKVFLCYAREDGPLVDKLKRQLQFLVRAKLIEVWYDRDISGGENWEQAIDEHLRAADLILLLISPDFMASDYCWGVEMTNAMERHDKNEAQVVPIILRPVHWSYAPFGKLQAFPTDAKPITDRDWPSLDHAFFDVAANVERVIIALSERLKALQEELARKQLENVLNFAQKEARSFQHAYIGTEHLLLGLVREGEGIAAKVLANLGVELNKVRSAVEFIIGRGDRIVLGEIGLTPRAKKVIELAVDEARRLNHHYLGTEHLLLGMIREGEGIAWGVLDSLGVNLEQARRETIRVLTS